MSSEKQPQSNEALSNELTAELETIAQSKENLSEPEENGENNQALKAEQARTAIEKQPSEQLRVGEAQPKPAAPPNNLDRTAAYRETMRSLQRQLQPASRAFSKFIHRPAIEKASELASQTIMRPSFTLGATLTPLIIGGSLYFLAKRYGFALRGSELILLLIFGGIMGLFIELVSKPFRRRP